MQLSEQYVFSSATIFSIPNSLTFVFHNACSRLPNHKQCRARRASQTPDHSAYGCDCEAHKVDYLRHRSPYQARRYSNLCPGTILGHDGVGVVGETGSSVKGFKKGRRVPISWICSISTCEYWRRGLYSHFTTGDNYPPKSLDIRRIGLSRLDSRETRSKVLEQNMCASRMRTHGFTLFQRAPMNPPWLCFLTFSDGIGMWGH